MELSGSEASIRASLFIFAFSALALWELIQPRRDLRIARWRRWFNNLGLLLVNTAVIRIIFPAAAVGAAFWAEQHSWGLLNQISFEGSLVNLVILFASVVFLDLCIWYQHKLFHTVPLLWRLHQVHHADPDFDLTTGLRFHPVEVLLSMFIKIVLILVFGFSALSVLIFEAVLNTSAMFTHANVRISQPVDRFIRVVFVTPDMHRVHHSWRPGEANSNYGFNLAVWDRLFKTYKEDSVDGQLGITFGVSSVSDADAVPLWRLLKLPFKS